MNGRVRTGVRADRSGLGMGMLAVAGVLAALLPHSSALGQFSIFSNAAAPGSPALNPQATTASGVSAPAGTMWSEAVAVGSEANALAGVSGQGFGTLGTYRCAEDFIVPAGRSYELTSVWAYAYQPGAGASVSPFGAVNVQIWNGRPDQPGSAVVWGDTTTNRLNNAAPTAVYRVFSSGAAPATTPDTTRPIWRLQAATPVTLGPGTYWIDWQVMSTDPLGEAFTPTATVAGTRTQAGWNALQFKPSAPPLTGGTWSAIVDPGKPAIAPDTAQALPFILNGFVRGCVADYDGSGQPTIDDLFLFLNGWFVGDSRADVNGVGGITIDDLFIFLNNWFTGCS